MPFEMQTQLTAFPLNIHDVLQDISTNVILLTVGMTTKFMFIPFLIQLMNVAKKDTVSYRAIGFEYDVVI